MEIHSYKNEGNASVTVTTDRTAFIPFSYGPANCAGKNLALVEMRMVVTLLVQRFDMRFPDDYDVTNWEAHLKDFYTFEVGDLPVILTSRI